MVGSISAIIPTFNRSHFLAEAVTAILNQTRPVDEIIIWDDGCTDNTADVVANLKTSDPDNLIRYFQNENRGKSAALNAALSETTGDYIWICDDDDIAFPDAAEKMAIVLDQGTAGLVGGKHVRFSNDPESGAKEYDGTGYWPDLASGSIVRHMLEDIFFFQNASMVRKSCFDTVGPFREDLARSIDYEMFVRLGTRFPIDMVDAVLFEQRKHEGARGPAAQSHAAKQSESVWLESDRKIFHELRSKLPLSFYASFFESSSPELIERAALLQRACVYARRVDWSAAVEDLENAAKIGSRTALTQTESEIVIRLMAAKHGPGDCFFNPIRSQLLAISKLGIAGQGIVSAIKRGSKWRAREALQKRDLRALTGIMQLSLGAGFAAAPTPTHSVTERSVLELWAYGW